MLSVTSRKESGTYSESLTNRSKIRTTFLEKERQEINSYIHDLENNLAINKSMLSEILVNQSKDSKTINNSMVKLNKENLQLQTTIKELRRKLEKERNQNLILEQLLEEMRFKNGEQVTELKEKNNELMEQLKLKEYYLQVFEKKCNDAEFFILKYLRHIPEAVQVIQEIHSPIKKGVIISNVVIQNEELKKKIKELNKEINKLKTESCLQETRKVKETLKLKINTLTMENNNQKEKLSMQTKINQELYELNNKLTKQLKNLNDQVNVLIHSTKIIGTEGNSHRSKEHTLNPSPITEVPKRHKDFDELSSISSEEDDGKYAMKGELIQKGLSKRASKNN